VNNNVSGFGGLNISTNNMLGANVNMPGFNLNMNGPNMHVNTEVPLN
jgi:hypothetical protein